MTAWWLLEMQAHTFIPLLQQLHIIAHRVHWSSVPCSSAPHSQEYHMMRTLLLKLYHILFQRLFINANLVILATACVFWAILGAQSCESNKLRLV